MPGNRHLLLLVLGAAIAGYACAERSIYFSLMVSTAPGLNTAVVAPAVEFALDDINNDPSILPGYKLRYTRVADTKVS